MRQNSPVTLASAYAHCRAVARREAKNFYWAFRVLPPHKSDAMCAVYAFMRKADDLADDESLTLDERRAAMAAWTAAWRAARETGTTDPVFVALRDTQARFAISDVLLEQLVAGTTMDLQPQLEGTVVVQEASLTSDGAQTHEYLAYQSFDALYRYCYLVASVVGLVTIRIFGYSDAEAERLAERTGIAFQLTNILRDVREDAERGRIYVPLDDLQGEGVSVEHFVLAAKNLFVSPESRSLLAREVERAREFYGSAYALIPLIAKDARPAMEALITIYYRLLERIAAEPEAVLRERVSVHISEKLGILGRGLIASGMARLGT